MPGMVMNPPIDVTLTIRPERRALMPGNTALIGRIKSLQSASMEGAVPTSFA